MANTDMHALLEQALILGKDAMEQSAALHCKPHCYLCFVILTLS